MHLKKLLIVSASIGWCLASLQAFAWDVHQSPFTLTIASTGGTSFQANSAILLSIVLTNISDRDMKIADTNPFCDYVIKVTGENGKRAELTPLGHRLLETTTCIDRYIRNSISTVSPAETEPSSIDIIQLFDLSAPGTYTVRAERTITNGTIVPQQWSGESTRSNPLTARTKSDGVGRGDGPDNAGWCDPYYVKSNVLTVTVTPVPASTEARPAALGVGGLIAQ